jgi:glutathione peroxidase
MKTLILVLTLFFSAPPSIYTYKLNNIDGKNLDLKKYKGKKILIVNTASKCGFTKQYADLQKLADAYKDKLIVIGFPANNFGGQEPGENLNIKEFCQKNFGVTFPLAEKSSVKAMISIHCSNILPLQRILILRGILNGTLKNS